MKNRKRKSAFAHKMIQEFESDLESNDASEAEISAELASELGSGDPHFKSELDYEGYHSIEEADNNAYGSLDPERNEDTPIEITIRDREEEQSSGEESPIDPQENRA